MASPCYIVYKGKQYTYEDFMLHLHDGELNKLIGEKVVDENLLTGKLPKEGGTESAISIEKPSPGVLGKEGQKVELPQVGKGEREPEKPAGKVGEEKPPIEEKKIVPPPPIPPLRPPATPTTGGGAGGKKPPTGKNITEPPPQSVNPEVAKRLKASHGIKKVSIFEKIKGWFTEFKQTLHHFKYVRESEFPLVYNKLRLIEEIPAIVKKESYEKIADIAKPIAKNKILYEAFERYVVTNDLVPYVEETNRIPFGYNNIDEIKEDAKNLQEYADKNPELKKVIEGRKAMMDEIRKELIDNHLLKEGTKENQNYFHHQVLAQMTRKGMIVGSKDVRLHKKGFQNERIVSKEITKTEQDLDFNTNYVESEYEVLTQALEQIRTKQLLNEIGANIDIKPELEKLAEEKGGNYKDYMPADYTIWHPKSGTNAFKAASVTEKAVQEIVDGLGDTKVLNELIAESEKTTWVIPEKVAAQLDEMKVPHKEMFLTRISRTINSSWKQWILLNPYRVLKYNLNNMSGDLDITLAYSPSILKPKYAHSAMKELWKDLKGKGMSTDMKEALDQGAITTGLSIQEIPDINNEGVFRSLTGKDNLIEKYWKNTKDYTQFRENLLRLASYKYFKDQLSQGKKLYGASDHKAIDAIIDIKEKAGKLSRELIGDYGNLSQGGQWLRTHIWPFWSWCEINSPRYYRLLKNIKYEDNAPGSTGLRVAGIGAKKVAVNAAKLTAKMMAFAGLVTLWNRTFFNDEDDELTKTGNRQLRLIVGRRDDGSIMTIRMSGALSDMLSFVGLEDITQDIQDIEKGKASMGKKVKEAGNAFVNKMAQGIAPLEKATAEMIIGKSLYPDIFNPVPIRSKPEHILKTVSMDKVYRYLTKRPLRGAKELTGLIIYDTNPGEASYYTMRQRIGDFLEENNIESSASDPTNRSNALYYYKQSLKLKNEKLAKYWYDKYVELGGTEKGEKQSIQKGELIQSLPKALREKWLSTLDEEDKEILKMATDWYDSTYKSNVSTSIKAEKRNKNKGAY